MISATTSCSAARATQQAGNANQAIQDFQAYLTEYDPAWTGPAGSGSERLPMMNPPPGGKHVAMARFRLAESFHQSGNPNAARMELEDLLKMVTAPMDGPLPFRSELETEEGKKPPAEIRWLTVQSYFPPAQAMLLRSRNTIGQISNIGSNTGAFIGNTGGLPTAGVQLYTLSNGDLDQALKSRRDHLANHPVRAAWMIAEVLQTAGRADDAATTIEKELRALFRSGQILASQKSNNDNWNQQRRQGQQKCVLRYAWKLVSNPPDRA